MAMGRINGERGLREGQEGDEASASALLQPAKYMGNVPFDRLAIPEPLKNSPRPPPISQHTESSGHAEREKRGAAK